MTGAIVEYLCLKTEVNGIIRTYNLGDDPNFENEGYGLKYKNAMLNRIKEKQIKCVKETLWKKKKQKSKKKIFLH